MTHNCEVYWGIFLSFLRRYSRFCVVGYRLILYIYINFFYLVIICHAFVIFELDDVKHGYQIYKRRLIEKRSCPMKVLFRPYEMRCSRNLSSLVLFCIDHNFPLRSTLPVRNSLLKSFSISSNKLSLFIVYFALLC